MIITLISSGVCIPVRKKKKIRDVYVGMDMHTYKDTITFL